MALPPHYMKGYTITDISKQVKHAFIAPQNKYLHHSEHISIALLDLWFHSGGCREFYLLE
jgi:hypothetical protein